MLRSVLILALQASTYGPPSPGAQPAQAEDKAADDRCPPSVSNEIVVCKRRPATRDSQRYGPSSHDPDPWGQRLHIGVGNGSVDGHSFANARGTTADGITLSIPF